MKSRLNIPNACGKASILLVLACLSAAGPARAASASFSWNAVTTNADGSALTDLAGYRLFQFSGSLLSMTTAQAMANVSVIKTDLAGNGTTATVNNLAAGSSYFFRLAAYDTAGNQSGFNVDASNNNVEISTTIPAGNIHDVNKDGSVNVADVQLAVNQALAITACSTGDVNGDAVCNVSDVQIVVNKALGL